MQNFTINVYKSAGNACPTWLMYPCKSVANFAVYFLHLHYALCMIQNKILQHAKWIKQHTRQL